METYGRIEVSFLYEEAYRMEEREEDLDDAEAKEAAIRKLAALNRDLEMEDQVVVKKEPS